MTSFFFFFLIVVVVDDLFNFVMVVCFLFILREKNWCLAFNSEKAMAPHSSTLAGEILWSEEPGKLQSMGSLTVRHD